MSFAVGSLVQVRGREWVVLPESTEDLLMLKPLGGSEEERTGIYLPLEIVKPARFALPDASEVGDYRSCRLLRDAVRLGTRSSAGPFRSFGRLSVEPRPYQLVPLLLGLRLDPVRLLIADDVGIGKTIEALLIVREMLDRGEIRRFAVLCPPHLAEQWQEELATKFHIEAELVLASTARRLDQFRRGASQSIFEVFPHVIVSTDYIKADRRRDDFLRSCPEMVVVDEAHTFSFAAESRSGRHQRHELLKGLAKDPDRHILLVTATPHSGKEDAFRSLLGFLDPALASLPEDLSGKEREADRRRLACHLVQRRRPDIRRYLDAETVFPDRETKEETYTLSPEYKKLFQKTWEYAKEIVKEAGGARVRQRVRWWSALALLRSLASSPAAAAATMRNRAENADAETEESADQIARPTVMDLMDDQATEGNDVAPGSDLGDDDDEARRHRRRLLEMAREADALQGAQDAKLQKIAPLLRSLVHEGFRPILFCRFIPTAEYVADELRAALPKGIEVASVTGTLPPDDRKARVEELARAEKRVLVCTDCLSEGINLQEHFDAVIHYDLSWNPTRHEQREGRVDRFGQPRKVVRAVTYYGTDNQIDGIVLEILYKKHKEIRTSLGVWVPVPVGSEQAMEAIFEGLLLREQAGRRPHDQLALFEDDVFLNEKKNEFQREWQLAADREKRSRTLFAQASIQVDEVATELRSVREAIGSGVDLRAFLEDAVRTHGGTVSGDGVLSVDLKGTPRAFRESAGEIESFRARFDLPVDKGDRHLTRTHPVLEGIASYVLTSALDPAEGGAARRCGAIRTTRVTTRTTALLLRFRFHILTTRAGSETRLLAEECRLLAFEGAPESAKWLEGETAEALLCAEPSANIEPDQQAVFVQKVLDGFDTIRPHLKKAAEARADELLDSHRRVRKAAKERGVTHRVEAQDEPDVIGIYVYLPAS